MANKAVTTPLETPIIPKAFPILEVVYDAKPLIPPMQQRLEAK